MLQPLKTLLNKYNLKTTDDCRIALREIIQQIALLGLWRAKFYEHAAFYGGTALRIFYGLSRYSEDLDFSLTAPNPDFSMIRFIQAIQIELESFGFSVKVDEKKKTGNTHIKSAFIKAETLLNFLHIEAPANALSSLPSGSVLKIKLEIDIDPPAYADYEIKTALDPIPHYVKLYAPADLFAGKIHAVLCREWKTRVKGRDFYDFVWFIGQNIPCHLKHLKARMVQTAHLEQTSELNREILIQMLKNKFEKVDFQNAIADVRPFIQDSQSLDLWDKSFFMQLTEQVRVKE